MHVQIGTFSWLAAFFSHATEIHFPLAGMFHPDASHHYMENNIALGDLTVFDEPRYIYHDLINRKWWGKYNMCTNNIDFHITPPVSPGSVQTQQRKRRVARQSCSSMLKMME